MTKLQTLELQSGRMATDGRLSFFASVFVTVYFMSTCSFSAQAGEERGNLGMIPDNGLYTISTPHGPVNVKRAKVVDAAVTENMESFFPENLPFFEKDLRPILVLANSLPDFGKSVNEIMVKSWRLDPNGFLGCPRRQSIYGIRGNVEACQDEHSIAINPDYFGPPQANEEEIKPGLRRQRREIELHEIVRGIALTYPNLSETSMDLLFRFLVQQPLPTTERLQRKLIELGLGNFKTKDQMDQAETFSKQNEMIRKMCKQTNMVLQPENPQAAACFIRQAKAYLELFRLEEAAGELSTFEECNLEADQVLALDSALSFSKIKQPYPAIVLEARARDCSKLHETFSKHGRSPELQRKTLQPAPKELREQNATTTGFLPSDSDVFLDTPAI